MSKPVSIKRSHLGGLILTAVAIAAAVGLTAYQAGHKEQKGALDCRAGVVLELTRTSLLASTESTPSSTGNGPGEVVRLSIGNCDRIETDAFVAAVAALAGEGRPIVGCDPAIPPASTATTTSVKAATSPPETGSAATTTSTTMPTAVAGSCPPATAP